MNVVNVSVVFLSSSLSEGRM